MVTLSTDDATSTPTILSFKFKKKKSPQNLSFTNGQLRAYRLLLIHYHNGHTIQVKGQKQSPLLAEDVTIVSQADRPLEEIGRLN